MIKIIKPIAILTTFLLSLNVYSLSPAPPESAATNPLFITMSVLAVALLMVIVILSGVLKTLIKSKVREVLENRNKSLIFVLMMLAGLNASAQETTQKSLYDSEPIVGIHPMAFYILFAFLVIELLVILWMCLLIMRMLVKTESVAKSLEEEKPSWIKIFVQKKLLGLRPVEANKDILLDHDYDGIKELDNDLPPWWKYGFYLTIISSVIYMVSYHLTHTSKSSIEEYEAEMADAERKVNAYRASLAMNVDETNASFLNQKDQLEKGKAIFLKNCEFCHGREGEGKVGPNFADNYWLYGNKPGDLFKIVKNGTAKGMKAWKDELSPVDIQNVISYIHSLSGTHPANPKAPEGSLMEIELSDSGTVSQLTDSSKSIEIKS